MVASRCPNRRSAATAVRSRRGGDALPQPPDQQCGQRAAPPRPPPRPTATAATVSAGAGMPASLPESDSSFSSSRATFTSSMCWNAPLRVLPQAAGDDPLAVPGGTSAPAAAPAPCAGSPPASRSRVPLERPPPGHHLVQHRAEAEDVRAGIHLLPLGLLRRHVGHRPDDRALFGRGLRRCASGRRSPRGAASVSFARPKSSTLTRPSSVTMTLAGFRSRWTMPGRVRRGQRIRDLDGVLQRLAQPHPLARDQLVERLALHVLHGDEVDAVRLVDVVDRDDVGVVERGGGLGFLDEARACARGRRPSPAAGPSGPRSGPGGCRGPCRRRPCRLRRASPRTR